MAMRFSERQGHVPVRQAIQIESMDSPLRNGLWNQLTAFYILSLDAYSAAFDFENFYFPHLDLKKMTFRIWAEFFKLPTDELVQGWARSREYIHFYFINCEWYKVYDFLEFVPGNANRVNEIKNATDFKAACNAVMARELSGYRFVGGKIVPVTSDEEIQSIETALKDESISSHVRTHLTSALEFLADRESPDYRNSIKESISAVESICNSLSNSTGEPLGAALNAIERNGQVVLHSALKEAFSKLYGWTSNADGIRHALMEESNLDSEDAMFMLVACSAFINYLTVKSDKAGIQLTT